MANTAAFIAGGLLTGIGNAGMQFALEEVRSQRDLMLRKIDQEYRSGESATDRAFRSEEALKADERRNSFEDRREENREARDAKKPIGGPVMNADGEYVVVTGAGEAKPTGVKGDTSASEERRARAEWYKSGRPGSGPGGRGGTEFERLTAKLADMEDDDPSKPLIEQRLAVLAKNLSSDQRLDKARMAAQADVRGDPTLTGKRRDDKFEERLNYYKRLYDVPGAAPAPAPAPAPEQKPGFFERNNPFGGSSEPKAAPAPAPQAPPAAQAPQVKPSVNALPAPRDPTQRKIGQVYTGANGRKAMWTGEGWQPVP